MKGPKVLAITAFVVCIFPLSGAALADGDVPPANPDTFLKIDGVRGTAQDSAHQGWFELTYWGWVSPVKGGVPKVACHTHEAKFSAAPNTPAELRLKQMCDTRTHLPTLTVDVKGTRHVLQNVSFRMCEGQFIGGSMLKVFTIYFDACVTHRGVVPEPVARLNINP